MRSLEQVRRTGDVLRSPLKKTGAAKADVCLDINRCKLSVILYLTFHVLIVENFQLQRIRFVVWWSEFRDIDPQVPGSIPSATKFSEKQWVWNGVHSASSR
jgi:hypothetical protein